MRTGSHITRRPGFTFERAGAASMVYSIHEHRRARMLRLAAAYAAVGGSK